MDGTLAKWHNATPEELLEEGYFRNLEPNEDLLNDVNELISQGENVYILSCYLTDSKYALEEKKEWCREHLPELSEDKYVFVPYGESKAKVFNERGLSPITNTDYLIDDYSKNLFEWKEFGGIGVKYHNGINHTKGTWVGLRINEESPFNKKTDLFSFILGEKLKLNYNINLIAITENDISNYTNMLAYHCIDEKGYYHKIFGDPFWKDRHFELGCDYIADQISRILPRRNPDPFPYPDRPDGLLDQYFERHYPTLCEAQDFTYLLQHLDSNTLDDMEYTLYLYDYTDLISYDESDLGMVLDGVAADNELRINSDYVHWYAGAITTKDLFDNILPPIEEDIEKN